MFAKPRIVTAPEDCYFYHAIDLPGLGLMTGGFDLRPTIDAYLGGVDFGGKRVLDIGTAGGYLSFQAELRGARELVSFEMDDPDAWELVPFSDPASTWQPRVKPITKPCDEWKMPTGWLTAFWVPRLGFSTAISTICLRSWGNSMSCYWA